MNQLSPLNKHTMLARLNVYRDPRKRHATAVTKYECTDCGELHDWECDAEDCCEETRKHAAAAGDGTNCPVCGEGYSTHHLAADCCLWKDFDAATRWRMADAVAAGSTWAEQLGIQSSTV